MVFGMAGAEPTITLDIGDHTVDADSALEQGCHNWISVQGFASITTEAGALIVAAPDAPLVQPFGIQTEGGGTVAA